MNMLELLQVYRQNCCPGSRHMTQRQESICASLMLNAGLITWSMRDVMRESACKPTD